MTNKEKYGLPIGGARVMNAAVKRPRPESKISTPFPYIVVDNRTGRQEESSIVLCRLFEPLESHHLGDTIDVCCSSAISLVDLTIEDVILAEYCDDEQVYCARILTSEQSSISRSTFCLSVNAIPSKHSSESIAVAPFMQNPVPALSISLRYTAMNGEGAAIALEKQPLLQACLKRQLAGCPLFFRENKPTTMIEFTFQNVVWKLQVVSLVVSTRQKSSANALSAALILPSTRITILTVDSAICSEKLEEYTPPLSSISPAATSLLDTIKCIRSIHARNLNTDVARAFLLSGPPGVGKTHAVRLAERHSGSCHLVVLQGSQILAEGHAADAAQSLERQFQLAVQKTKSGSPQSDCRVAIVFLDECDALLASQDDSSISVIEAILCCLLDRMNGDPEWKRLVVVAATNRSDTFPASLRRPGRFDREIPMAPPNADVRFQILETLLRGRKLVADEKDELQRIAEACVGYVPADLAALVRRAEILRILQVSPQSSEEGCLDNSPAQPFIFLRRAMNDVGASALRDAALKAPPSTTWDDIAGDPGGAKSALRQAIEWPRTKRRAYEALGLTPPRGILLHGPPGCAKTTLARAAAGASSVAFLSLAPAEVFSSSYVGDAEAVVRRAFALARSAAPCVLFFDEMDAIVGTNDGSSSSHGMGRGSSSSTEARVLSTFLNEMDGVDGSWNDGVLVLGATNRPWTLDAALLRPGRFDKIIYVPPPDFEGRRSILSLQFQHWNAENSNAAMDLDRLASDSISGDMTGAEIVGACRVAAMRCFREAVAMDTSPEMKEQYVDESLRAVKPLLSNASIRHEYESFELHRKGLSG